jgi:large subunit ribosomal protein L33
VGSSIIKGIVMRELIALSCDICKAKNYTTDKNKKNTPSKLQFKKYCPRCGKHTLHKETHIK